MRIMAVDYGDARTGIAVSDASAALPGDAWVVHEKVRESVAAAVVSEALARGVGTIVVGYPRNMDGTAGPRAEKSERFAELLRSILRGLCGKEPSAAVRDAEEIPGPLREIEVKLWDERMTTLSAHRILSETGRRGRKRKEKVDAVAASLILESYLSSLGNR